MIRQKPVPQKKVDEIKNLVGLINKFKIIGLAHLEKMPASAIQDLRSSLRKDVIIHVSKKRLINRAFKECKKPNLEELGKMMTGITALLFTDMSPITLSKYLESKAVKGHAKGGDIAPIDIIVPAGDTKLAPGPIISELSQNLKVQTQVKDGTVHIRADTVTHKKGTIIKDKEAQLLTRLGLTPMDVKLDFYCAWEQGEILPDSILHLDEKLILGNFTLGVSQAINVAMSANIISKETITPIMLRGIRIAQGIALKLPFFIPDLLPNYVSVATREVMAIETAALGISHGPSPSAKSETKKESKAAKKEEKPAEEDSGIGNLFG